MLVAHIVVLGYWLGAELVINSEYRYVSRSPEMPFAERNRLMEHVMDVDQHVRYALVLQAGLGVVLSALWGYLPGGAALAWSAAGATALWLAFVEVVHRLRHRARGRSRARIDRVVRYALMAALAVLALVVLSGAGVATMPFWLAWKLMFFAGVIASGVGIRLALVRFFRVWQQIAEAGPDPHREAQVRAIYVQATGVLWLFIAGIVVLSVVKPA